MVPFRTYTLGRSAERIHAAARKNGGMGQGDGRCVFLHVEDSNRPRWRWIFYFCSDGDEGRVAWGRQIRMYGRIPPPRRSPPPPKMPVAATPKAIIIAASALPASAARRCLSLLPSLPTSASAKRYSTVME